MVKTVENKNIAVFISNFTFACINNNTKECAEFVAMKTHIFKIEQKLVIFSCIISIFFSHNRHFQSYISQQNTCQKSVKRSSDKVI